METEGKLKRGQGATRGSRPMRKTVSRYEDVQHQYFEAIWTTHGLQSFSTTRIGVTFTNNSVSEKLKGEA